MTKHKQSGKQPIQKAQLIVAEMPAGKKIPFSLVFDEEQLTAGQQKLDLIDLKKVRFEGHLSPDGKRDWILRAKLGASVTQSCVITLDPVRTRLEEDVTRHFMAQWQETDGDSVVEMDEDVESEPLGPIIDLQSIALEAISLAMPDYPRAPEAALETKVFAEPGVEAMTDEDAKPFAVLAALKEKIDK